MKEDNEFGKWIEFRTPIEAIKALNLNTNIYGVLKGKGRTVNGYICKYKEVVDEPDQEKENAQEKIDFLKRCGSRKRISKEEIDGIIFKQCTDCGEKKRLEDYYTKCGNLLSDCKKCNIKKSVLYIKERKNKDMGFKILNNLRNRIFHALKNGSKSASTRELLGCSPNEYLDHLELQFDSSMNWENYGSYWQIDHIIPCSA